MQSFSELEQEAMKLPERQRATLAWRLLDSLPGVLSDDDEGVAEAIRRDAELERDPAAGLSLEELSVRLSARNGADPPSAHQTGPQDRNDPLRRGSWT